MFRKRVLQLCLLCSAGAAVVAGLLFVVPTARKAAQADPPGGLTRADVATILSQGVAGANATDSAFRTLPAVQKTRMVIAVVARSGKLLDVRTMPDAWVGSVDIAIAKARTAAFFSSNQNALTSRIIGQASQPNSPLWGVWASNQVGITGGPEYRNGVITFPGGVPLYKSGQLVGGVGVSGDGVDQDEAVAFAAEAGFAPPTTISRLGF